MEIYIQIEFKVEGHTLETPFFKHEDSCLLYINKHYPSAVDLITIQTPMYSCYSNYVHNKK
jgi:hypothetical protein